MSHEPAKTETWEALVDVEYPTWRLGFPKLFRRCAVKMRVCVRRGEIAFEGPNGLSKPLKLAPPGTKRSIWSLKAFLLFRPEDKLLLAEEFHCVDERTFRIEFPPDEDPGTFRIADGCPITSHEIKRILTGEPK